VPPSPAIAAELPPPEIPPRAQPSVPAEFLQPGTVFTLAQVVDVALRTSPITRQAWLQARSAAAQAEAKRAAYYPALDLSASAARGEQSPDGRAVSPLSTWGPSATLSYLLLDFGGRSANAADARHALLAADWSHEATIQSVVLAVQETYFGYQNAKAQTAAAQAAARQAETALAVAKGRHDAGVATIADVLQARTALSQARFNLAGAEGQVLTLRGALATAMGLPADLPFDVGSLPGEPPLDAATTEVEPLISQALGRRPDLNASREQAAKAAARVRSVRSEGLPALALSASASRNFYHPQLFDRYHDNWSARALVTYPLFSGFSNTYNLQKAREDEGASRAQTEAIEQQVILQVWTAYYRLRTAAEQVRAARDLLASAEQSEQVALGRYKEGVGTILDLLTAESALARAHAQEIQARADFFIAAARLAQSVGAATVADTAVVTEKRQP
jgi:outer membrane protein TolC